ncbi:transaldolase [Robiginitalea sp. SC105]|uniref:TlpA family protein disulfide reductase n=1 Tax=Robiginitalea sp. SC105 TaxID=2762332 RepID=UPI001639EF89|nr:transaldolase [Robiginitalea sp. SC105]MBC2840730.1 transaldolase [Robiginitalea sp. SC105]
MLKKYIFVFLLVLVCSCGDSDPQSSAVFIGGEIVNPTANNVVLFKGETAVDSAFLDENNRFEIRVDSLEDGLYYFLHKPEMQYVYLEQGDSLQIRLNTVAFDESLIFSGRGEVINNFQLEVFLDTEKEEQVIREAFFQLEPQSFSAKLDSLSDRKVAQLNELQEEEGFSKAAYDLAYASIRYKYWTFKEGYPFWHRRASDDKTLHSLPDDFYAYRDQVSYSDPQLTYLRPYYDFMKFHIGNLAFMGCKEACGEKVTRVTNQLHFNRHQLQLIDSLVHQETLRDNLFRTVAIEYLLKHDSEENFEVFMEDFHQRSANNRHLPEIARLGQDIRNLRPNNPLPPLQVVDVQGEQHWLRDIPREGQQIVFYFWSGPEQRHLKNITQRVRQLQEHHPEYRYVGICMRTDMDQWKSLMASYSLDPGDQFLAPDYEQFAHALVVYNPYKSVIAKDGIIIDGFANLNTSF